MILITGASGFVGQHVLREVLTTAEGSRVYALINRQQIPQTESSVYFVTGGLAEIHLQHELLAEVNCIIHLAAQHLSSDKNELYETNVEGTRNITRLAQKIKAKIIYVSSTGVYGHKSFEHATEDTPKCPDTHFSTSKYMAENVLKESGVPFLILRHRFIIGCGDRFVVPSFIKASMRLPFRIGKGKNVFSFIDVVDMAKIITWFSGSDWSNLRQREYHINNGERVSFRQIENTLSDVFALRVRKKISVSYTVARLVIGAAKLFKSFFRARRVEDLLVRLKFLTYANHFSNKQLVSVLDNFRFTSFEESVRNAKNYYDKYLSADI